MKKISLLLFSAITLLFTACAESKFEMHNTHFEPMNPDGLRFYADQTYDTIKVHSLDPWKAEIEASIKWFNITPTSGGNPGTPLRTRIDIRMPQNTTGKNYTGRIIVKTYDDNSIAMPIYQCSWLNIMYPTPIMSEAETFEEKKATFRLTVPATEKKATISFHTYTDEVTLTCDSEWLTLPSTPLKKGHNSIDLGFTPNSSNAEREAKLVLTSGEISTPIYVKQGGKQNN